MTTQLRPGRPPAASPTLTVASRHGVTRTQLAALFDVPTTTVDAWRRAGCPRLASGLFVPARVLVWIQRRADAAAESKAARSKVAEWDTAARRALALTRLHDLAVKRGEFLPKATVVAEWARRCFALRTSVLAVPRAIAGAVNVPPEIRAQIEHEGYQLIREVLLEFVRAGAVHEQPATESLDGTDAAAAAAVAPPTIETPPPIAAPARRRRDAMGTTNRRKPE